MLVIKPRGANSGLNRYKGEGVYRSIGRKNTSLRKATKEEADAINLKKKSAGKGIDVSTNTMDSADAVDSGKSVRVDEDSAMKAISNSSIETALDEDKESIVDEGGESTKVDEHSKQKALSNSSNGTVSDEDAGSISDDKEEKNENELDEKENEGKEESGIKRKFPTSYVDSIINKSSGDELHQKINSWNTSFLESHDKDDASTTSNVNECDIQPSELLKKDKKEDHSLIKIPPTKRRKYSQRACAHCRQKYGIRNDTRYICTLCNVALCQEPCFSDYHCNK